MLSINTNHSSLIAQNSLKNSTLKLNNAVERMTTGYKINRAKDNAANYSITTNMATKLGAYEVAEDNCSMGLDLLTTANESLNLISDKLARLRALAEQAANGTYGKQSLDAIYAEADAITDEIYRVKNNTEYNGKKILGENTVPNMSGLRPGASGFIQDISKRDTDSMTTLASVNESAVLAKGTYSISSAEELAKLARMQNSGKISADSEFVLGADIDLSGYSNWTPIGWANGNSQTTHAFNGTFDGNGYKISNLKSSQSTTSAAGLFGSADDAVFKNIGFENINLSGKYTGSLLAVAKDNSNITLSNCYAENVQINTTANDSSAGGLIGGKDKQAHVIASNHIILTSCYTNDVNIRGWWSQAGGILGTTDSSSIKDCFSMNLNTSTSASLVGGIVGISQFAGTIEDCYAQGNITDTSNSYNILGGIAGGGDLKIQNCYFEGLLDGGETVGGIFGGCCGVNPVYIENCSVNADIKGRLRVGGISGWQDGEGGYVKNCHLEGKISGKTTTTNVGYATGGGVEEKLKIENCTYNKFLNGEKEAIGDGLGTVSSIVKTVIQAGIHADENSQIEFNTLLICDELNKLCIFGIQQDDIFETIDNLSLKISEMQTNLGATQNKLESALDEISTKYENLTSSRSTLQDADIAKVSSEYIQQQILQQASATLMATANQTPALALQLL